MDFNTLIERFSATNETRQKAIFSTLFIAGNRLQTLFDSRIPALTLKQFMLLSLVRQAERPPTLTRLGEMLGCSRQNIKKLAVILEKKGFVTLCRSARDPRAICVSSTQKTRDFFQKEFAVYESQLAYLFEVYTEEEIRTLFALMAKLYAGIDNLERRTAGARGEKRE